jgi:hypothetical protein
MNKFTGDYTNIEFSVGDLDEARRIFTMTLHPKRRGAHRFGELMETLATIDVGLELRTLGGVGAVLLAAEAGDARVGLTWRCTEPSGALVWALSSLGPDAYTKSVSVRVVQGRVIMMELPFRPKGPLQNRRRVSA